jgi:hypothetical protein
MNWDAIGAAGEIIGSVAVVVSLVYVSLQIRHANKQSEIAALRHTWDGLNQFCDQLSKSPETASIINRGRADLGSLNDDEYLIFEHIHLRLLNTLESWYLQVTQTSKPGEYRDQQLANIAGIVGGYLGSPGGRELWSRLRDYFPTIAGIVDANLSGEDA